MAGDLVSVRATIVVLAYGAEPGLEACLDAILADAGSADELIVIDNGFDGGPGRLNGYVDRIRLIGTGENLGFAGGCNLAASQAHGGTLVFVNSDAVVRPASLSPLIGLAGQPGTGIACGCLRLASDPDLVNSVGNPIHYTGVTWAGHCGEPATEHLAQGPVPVATGGFFALRREVWELLGGFHEVYFAYHEDTDLSLRCHLRGLEVVYVPAAVAVHHYEFSRNDLKMYLVERNRLMLVATVFPGAILRVVLPMVLLTEPMLLVMALLQGWARQKVRGWVWLLRHRRLIVKMRAQIQATRSERFTDADFAALLVGRIEPPMVEPPPGISALNAVLAAYWKAVGGSLSRR